MNTTDTIYVAGHRGMVGGAIVRALRAQGYDNIVTRTRAELDLTDARAVDDFFAQSSISHVFLAAALVGGIGANQERCGAFIRDNLLIQTHVIHAARCHGVARLIFLGSSCIYPRLAPQPIGEEHLMTGPLEPTNSAYAVAKIAGIEMCAAYRRQYGFDAFTVMPCNVYGIGDCFDTGRSHVAAALMHRIHAARMAGSPEIAAWGSGTPLREFIYSEDLGRVCVFLMRSYADDAPLINAGSGDEISVAGLAGLIAQVVGYRGRIVWDRSRPDGTPRKIMNSSRLEAMGWRPEMTLRDGLVQMYRGYVNDGTLAAAG